MASSPDSMSLNRSHNGTVNPNPGFQQQQQPAPTPGSRICGIPWLILRRPLWTSAAAYAFVVGFIVVSSMLGHAFFKRESNINIFYTFAVAGVGSLIFSIVVFVAALVLALKFQIDYTRWVASPSRLVDWPYIFFTILFSYIANLIGFQVLKACGVDVGGMVHGRDNFYVFGVCGSAVLAAFVYLSGSGYEILEKCC